MKPIYTLLSAAFALTSCLASRDARVESDYSYSGDFRHYRTFSFIRNGGSGLNADTSHLDEALREAIRQRLLAQGYQPARRRPDMLVNYHVFQGDMKFRGYAQDELTQWMKNHAPQDDDTPEDQRNKYEPVEMLLAEGTLMVTLIDGHTQRAVWNGYASGVTVPEGPQGEIVLRRSVRSIFDRYRVFSEGFINGNSNY